MHSGLSKHSLQASRKSNSITSTIIRRLLSSPSRGIAIAVRISSFLRPCIQSAMPVSLSYRIIAEIQSLNPYTRLVLSLALRYACCILSSQIQKNLFLIDIYFLELTISLCFAISKYFCQLLTLKNRQQAQSRVQILFFV